MGDRRVVRIFVSEMKSYYIYFEWCFWLFFVVEGEFLGFFGVVYRRCIGAVRGFGCIRVVLMCSLVVSVGLVFIDLSCW